jgi:site-specific DNA-cytosine methylase
LASILETPGNPASIVGRKINADGKRDDYNKDIPTIQSLEVKKTGMDKSNCLTTVQKDTVITSLPSGRHMDVYNKGIPYRNYTKTELCRLQTVPEDYFKVSSHSQIVKMIGNGWTVDVIAHIFKNLEE